MKTTRNAIQKGKRMSTLAPHSKYQKLPYWLNVLLAIDQLGNAIADGNPDNTISARVGYFASDEHASKIKGYWKFLEKIINFAFAPIQGPGHCYRAWKAEQDEMDTQGSYIARIILAIFVAAGCLVITIFIRLAVLFNPNLGYPQSVMQYDTWRQSRKAVLRQA
jgi:hypothetical protein